jgi:cyclic dehypoxanthinyl futalosine synthase
MVCLGKIPYLNCEPFFAYLSGFRYVEMVPSALGRAMRDGTVDAAPLSLVDLLELGPEVVALPFGIAISGPVQSVVLFSRRPIVELGGATIGVTPETSTSVELLKLLLAHRFEVEPGRWVAADAPADAVLLIGDQALRALGAAEWPHRLDLAEVWARWTGLPFVFARWGARASLPVGERQRLSRALGLALETAFEPTPLAAIARRRGDCALSEEEVARYLRAFTYRLGDDEDKAIAEFRYRRSLPLHRQPVRADRAGAGRLAQVRDKVEQRARLDRAEGHWLITAAPLLDLGGLAHRARSRRVPEQRVTFVIDSNPNYTNVCITDCQFCAFYRKPGDPEAWTLTVEQVLEKIEFAAGKGATTVLLQGGHNPALPLEYYLDIVRETRRRFPQVTPHFFTASEIQTMAQVSGLSMPDVLRRLREAGQDTLPGGGAEVLSERVRKRIEPKKGGPRAWLDVHREAHRQGFKSTATMMYGHVEEPDDIVDHWDAIRELQDEHGGFTAFVPWSFKPGNTLLEKWIKTYKGPSTYLRMLAASRLYLDNFDHVQASWFSEGKRAGQVALSWGADDFGGTLFEENVHAAADYVNKTTVDEIITLIRDAGFTPAQRTTEYQILREY